MADSTKMSATCRHCGASLAVNHTGLCPKCGKKGKDTKVVLSEAVKVITSLTWEKQREFFETNRKLRNVIIAIIIISPVLGLYFSGVLGLIIGLVLGIVSYILSPYAVMKVREIERGSSK